MAGRGLRCEELSCAYAASDIPALLCLAGIGPPPRPAPPRPPPPAPQNLSLMVRGRANRKRAAGSITWIIGGHLEIAVKLFQMVQPQRIPAVSE